MKSGQKVLKLLVFLCFLSVISYFYYAFSNYCNELKLCTRNRNKKLALLEDTNKHEEKLFATRTIMLSGKNEPKISSSSVQNSSKEIVTTKDCSMWRFPTQVEGSTNPRFPLDPKRFLYPGLIWGPNNQIKGLQQAIYLAIKLNRTLVIPQFQAHDLNPGELSPYQTLDVQRLGRFVSCVSLERFRDKCNGSFDVAFQGTSVLLGHVTKFEKETQLTIRHPKRIYKNILFPSKLKIVQKYATSDIPTLPNLNLSLAFGSKLPADNRLKSAFNTSASCAVAVSIFKWFEIYPVKGAAFPLEAEDFRSESDLPNNMLYSAVVDALRHPPCIIAAADKYSDEVFASQKYVAVHWRYDDKDFGRICKESWAKYFCDHMNNIKPNHLANAIVKTMKDEVRSISETQDFYSVYIATPPSLRDFADEVYTELERLNKQFAKPSLKINEFLAKNYNSCWAKYGWKNVGDIESLCEMEVMLRSSWFFYSSGSTWSNNIRPFRTDINKSGLRYIKFETDVFKLAVMEMEATANDSLVN